MPDEYVPDNNVAETHVTKNYFTDNGDELVIGGKLTILQDALIDDQGDEFSSGSNLIAYQADSTATTIAALKDDFNALLHALEAAGLMESPVE